MKKIEIQEATRSLAAYAEEVSEEAVLVRPIAVQLPSSSTSGMPTSRRFHLAPTLSSFASSRDPASE
jgi:hypothetical protein